MSKQTFKLLIVGSRSFTDFSLLCAQASDIVAPFLDTHEVIVVSGGAKGADTLGEQFADTYGYNKEIYLAKWNDRTSPTYNSRKGYDPVAGYARNEVMRQELVKGDAYACLALWDGKSRGTQENFGKLKAKGIPTRVCEYDASGRVTCAYNL